MTLIKVATSCGQGSCPTVYVDHGTATAVIQGYEVRSSRDEPDIPDGQARVRIPRSLLLAADDRLAADAALAVRRS